MGLTNTETTVILNCVASDLRSIEQNHYEDIIQKMKCLPIDNLESVLEILNMHVIHNTATTKKQNSNRFRIVQ